MAGLGSNPNRASGNEVSRTYLVRVLQIGREPLFDSNRPPSSIPAVGPASAQISAPVGISVPGGPERLVEAVFGPWDAAVITMDLALALQAELIPEIPNCPAVHSYVPFVPNFYTSLEIHFPMDRYPAMEEVFKVVEADMRLKVFLPMNAAWAQDGATSVSGNEGRSSEAMRDVSAEDVQREMVRGSLEVQHPLDAAIREIDPGHGPVRILTTDPSPAPRSNPAPPLSSGTPPVPCLPPAAPLSTDTSTASIQDSPYPSEPVEQSSTTTVTRRLCPCCQRHCAQKLQAATQAAAQQESNCVQAFT